MNILGTQYTLDTKSFEIYVAGCSGEPHCVGCHNPESWDFSHGEQFNMFYFKNKIHQKVEEFDNLIDNIMIFGGEPLDQDIQSLESLLSLLKDTKKKIWMFTRYSINDVPEFVKRYCHYIKCGAYIPELIVDDNIQYVIKLATSNQHIYKKGVDY